MSVNRWSGLCSLCSRVVDSSRGRSGGWRTLTGGRTGEGHASITDRSPWITVVPRRLCHGDRADLYQRESVQRYLQLLMEDFRHLSEKFQLVHLSESDRKEVVRKHTELLPLANIYSSIEQTLKEHEEVISLLQGG